MFFRDPGRSPAELEARRGELGPRTLARRSKVRAGPLVDEHDLLPAAAYVEAVEHSGATLRVESRWLNAVSVEADAETQRTLEALPFVLGLHPVARAQAHDEEMPLELGQAPAEAMPDDYGVGWAQIEAIGVDALHDCGLTGAGVIMAVQDSGFLLDHQAYANTQVLATHDFIDDDDIVGPEPGDPADQHFHGTWVLATITGDDPGKFRGVAPGVSVILSKTEDTTVEQPAEEDTYVAGLEWIEGMGADIFSGSLIYQDWYTIDDLDGASAVTSVAIEAAVGNGLIVFTSMGNTGPMPSSLGAPADAEGAISLGAINVAGELAGFSSRGPTADGRIKPDLVAPGWDVYTVDVATLDAYVKISGTSFSTPISAGVGALLLEAYPWLTPKQMADLLRSSASLADAPDNDWGHGIVDAAGAGNLYCNCIDLDGDHYFDEACGGTDCADDQASAYPGAQEQCNGVDDDCDGALGADELDADADGFLACAGDCDDASFAVNPDAAEICDNGVDDDCDELIDGLDPDCVSGDTGSSDGDSSASDGSSASDASSEGASGSESGTGDDAAIDAGAGACACASTHASARSRGGLLILLFGLGFGVGRRRRRRAG